MEITILKTNNILVRSGLDWWWNRFVFGVETYYASGSELFIHIGFLTVWFCILKKADPTKVDKPKEL